MKRLTYLFMVSICFLTCKEKTENKEKIKEEIKEEEQFNPYEAELLDYREVNLEFNEYFGIDKFGIRRFNDSIYYFVLRLKDYVTDTEIDKYSMGLTAYSYLMDKKYEAVTNLKIRSLHDKNYLIIDRVPKNTKYLDSIEFYIYQRNNFKASGKQGSIKIFDILYE